MRIFAFLLCTMICLPLVGCSGSGTTQTPSQIPTETESPYPPADKLIALTFDDGPNESVMVTVLDLLEKYDITATFFVIGNRINESNSHVIKRAYDMGCEIGNHGYSHIRMGTIPRNEMHTEIDKTQEAVKAITGEAPKLFRPPYLSTSNVLGYEIGDMPFITGISGKDGTNDTNWQQRYDAVMNNVYDGCIVLMHCYSSATETVKALEKIIPELRMQGYEFVTVSQLFSRVGYTPETGTGVLIGDNKGQ